MHTSPLKPFLIAKDEHGDVRLTHRKTHYNSQGYPWVTQTQLEQTFKTAAEARAYAGERLGAKAGEFATK